LLALLFIVSCANNPFASYSSNISTPLEFLADDQIAKAAAAVSHQSDMLYYLEHGTIMRMNDNYVASNADFTNAQAFIDKWIQSFHNGSLGTVADTATASLINDKVLDYVAKDYEKVMIPTYKSLNLMALDNIDLARVEITRMYNIEDVIANYREAQYTKAQEKSDSRFKFPSLTDIESSASDKYNFNYLNSNDVLALKNSYQNAFSHYLAGFIFEQLNEPSLSRPGYVKALELNPGNSLIEQSIYNLDHKKSANNTTDVLVVAEIGHAPELKSVSLPIPFQTLQGQTSCINTVTFAFPELVLDKSNSRDLLAVDGENYNLNLFTDFNLMAARYLHDDLPNLIVHNTLRAVKDITLQQVSCNKGGALASLVSSITTASLGSADERSWVDLPAKIYATRLQLNYGQHIITVNNGNRSKQIKVNLNSPYTIITYRVIGSGIYFSPQANTVK
ncbi:MAG: hypothetical protein RL017_769, partial [Pseudomonadota bacterium]